VLKHPVLGFLDLSLPLFYFLFVCSVLLIRVRFLFSGCTGDGTQAPVPLEQLFSEFPMLSRDPM
jgi:hypothetical protein